MSIAIPPPPKPPISLLATLLLALWLGQLATTDLLAWHAQRLGVGMTYSVDLNHLNAWTHGWVAIATTVLFGIGIGHLYLAKANGPQITRARLWRILGWGLIFIAAVIFGATALYQAA